MDFVEIGLKFTYVLVVVAVGAALFLPLFKSLTTDPKSLVKGGIGLGFLLVVYLIGYAISGSEVTSSYVEFGVDSNLSKVIGGLINAMYLLMGVALVGILYTEFSKLVK
jgi:ABC-type sugar transport system permease subunit